MNLYKLRVTATFILILFQMVVFSQTNPQTKYIDSLNNLFKKSPKDSSRVILLEKISLAYANSDPSKGLEYADRAYKLATEMNLRNRQAASMAMMAVNHLAASNADKGIEYNKKAIEIYKTLNNKKSLAAVYSNLSQIYLRQGNYDAALEYSFNALTVYDQSKEYRNKGIVLENIANIHYELKNLKKARNYYTQVLEIFKSYGLKTDLARCMGNMSRVEMDKENYPKALEYLKKALEINQELGNKNSELINLTNIGNVYSKQKQNKKALIFMKKSLEMSEKLNMKNSIAVNKGNIGSIYLELYKESGHSDLNLLQNAIKNTEDAIRICDSIGFIAPKMEFSKVLTEAYSLQKDYKKAFEALLEKTDLSDSLKTIEANHKLSILETQRAQSLKEKDLVIKNKELEIIRLKSEKKTLFYSLIISILVITFAFIIRSFLQKQKKHNQILSEIKQIQSHEIRGPIASILGLTALLKEKPAEDLSRNQLLEGIEELALKLDEIVIKITKNSSL